MRRINYESLSKILESDDDISLVKLVGDEHEHEPIDVDMINSLAKECVELDALKCFIALIRGEVCNMHPKFDDATANLPDNGVNPLAYIAHTCPENPQLIDQILTNCAGTCLANVYCTIGLVHGLPIHFHLLNLSVVEHLYPWKRSESLIKLLILLCLWETKPVMDSLEVLVKHTDSINVVAWTTLKNGGLRQFVALLLVAREKVIAPFDNGLTIHHYITNEIDLITQQGELPLQLEELKCTLKDAQTLLTLFERLGDDLSVYRSSMKKYVSVDDNMEDICYLLVEHDVIVSVGDVCLAGCFHQGYKRYHWRAKSSDSVDVRPWERLDISYVLPRRFFFPSEVRPIDYSKPFKSRRSKYANARFGKTLLMPTCLQGRFYSTEACQVRDMSKSLTCTSVSRPVPRHLGYIAMRFINRIRFM